MELTSNRQTIPAVGDIEQPVSLALQLADVSTDLNSQQSHALFTVLIVIFVAISLPLSEPSAETPVELSPELDAMHVEAHASRRLHLLIKRIDFISNRSSITTPSSLGSPFWP